jgi:crossover junction endodeoxyribonuclease RusA
MPKPVILDLPVPPSVNSLYRNLAGRGRVKTARYKSWTVEAGLLLRSQRPRRIKGPYALVIAVPVKIVPDLGNLEKAVSDLLVAHQVVEDDRHAHSISLRRVEGLSMARVFVDEFELPAENLETFTQHQGARRLA